MSNGLLANGVEREVRVDGIPGTMVMESFGLREAGAALGRSLLTIRSWIENEIIPAPFATGVLGNGKYKQYFRFELEAIAEVLVEHERHSKYVTDSDVETIDRLWDVVEQVREGFKEAA